VPCTSCTRAGGPILRLLAPKLDATERRSCASPTWQSRCSATGRLARCNVSRSRGAPARRCAALQSYRRQNWRSSVAWPHAAFSPCVPPILVDPRRPPTKALPSLDIGLTKDNIVGPLPHAELPLLHVLYSERTHVVPANMRTGRLSWPPIIASRRHRQRHGSRRVYDDGAQSTGHVLKLLRGHCAVPMHITCSEGQLRV
jgi:hypothetical protein